MPSLELIELLKLANAALQALRAMGISANLLAQRLESGQPITLDDIRDELAKDDAARARIEAARNNGV